MATDERMRLLLEAKNNASSALKQVQNDMKGIDQTAQKVNDAMTGGLFGGAGGLMGAAFGISAVTAGVVGIGSAIQDTAMKAGQLDLLEQSFDQLAQKSHASSAQMLASMQAASGGMISDFDLIQSANRAMMLGVADSADELSALMQIARTRGQAMGLSMTQAFSDLVTGLGRASPMILDNLGIVLDADTVNQEYAKSIGKVASALTEQEKKQALVNAVMKEAANNPAPIATGAPSAAQQAAVAKENAEVAIGRAFTGPVREWNENVADFFNMTAGKFDDLAMATRELNDFLADYAAGNFQLTDEMAARFDQARAMLMELNAAIADGNPEAQAYARTLAQMAQAWIERGVTEQDINLLRLATESTRAAAQAQKEHNRFMGEAADIVNPLSFRLEQLAAATAKTTPEFVEAAGKLDALGQVALGSASDINTLNAAVGALEQRMAGMAPIFGQLQTMRQGAIEGLKTKALQAIEAGADPETVKQMYANTADEIWNMNLSLDASTEAMFDNQLAVTDAAKATDGYFQSVIDADAASKRAATQGVKDLTQAYDDLKSKVSGVIQESLNLDVGFDAQDLLPRQDAINENARRLAAIAKEGMIGQDWMAEFKAEVPGVYADLMLKQAEGVDVKQAAAQIMLEFQQGLRPEMLDKGQIKERVKQMILGEQSLSALAGEIAQELAGEMGVSVPEALGQVRSAMGLTTGKDEKGGAQDMTGEGASAGTTFVTGFATTANGGTIVGAILAQMTGRASQFNGNGQAAGTQWSSGFYASVETGMVPQLITLLVTLVTPGVAAALQSQQTQTQPQ